MRLRANMTFFTRLHNIYISNYLWQKEIEPSNSLRKWFGHDQKKWNEFKHRYYKELDKKKDSIDIVFKNVREERSVILLYSAKDEKFNNAVALKEYLEEKMKK